MNYFISYSTIEKGDQNLGTHDTTIFKSIECHSDTTIRNINDLINLAEKYIYDLNYTILFWRKFDE